MCREWGEILVRSDANFNYFKKRGGKKKKKKKLSGLATLQREMLHCDVLLWSSADPDSNFLKWVKTGIWNRFFSEYSRFICWFRLQNLSGSAAVLQSSTSQYSIRLWSACGPDASALKGADESIALYFLSVETAMFFLIYNDNVCGLQYGIYQ